VISLLPGKTGRLFLFTLLLLLIVASRAPYFKILELDAHDAWTMWVSVGTPPQIINRTPYDWGPLYYLILAAWQALVGNHVETGRVLSVLWLALGSAFLYRAARRLRAGITPFLAVLIYAASSGILLLSLNIRGYALQIALLPLAFWLMLGYFDAPVLNVKRLLLLVAPYGRDGV